MIIRYYITIKIYQRSIYSPEFAGLRTIDFSSNFWDEEIWKTGEKVMAELLEENNTLDVIASLEEKLFSKGFKERMLEELNA